MGSISDVGLVLCSHHFDHHLQQHTRRATVLADIQQPFLPPPRSSRRPKGALEILFTGLIAT